MFALNNDKQRNLKEVDAFGIPSIMAPKVKNVNVNTEFKKMKKSYLEKELQLDLHLLAEEFINEEISMKKLTGKMSEDELKRIFNKTSKQKLSVSSSAMREAMLRGYEQIIAGRSECHHYVLQRGFTGRVDNFKNYYLEISKTYQISKKSRYLARYAVQP